MENRTYRSVRQPNENTRRVFVICRSLLRFNLGLAIVSISAIRVIADETPDLRRPNIVFMMADDMGMGDTSAYQDVTGNRDVDQVFTPNMNRLARMGVRFTDAHTPSTRCTGTRYGLLTGRYPWRNRMKHWVLFGVQGDPMIERDRPTIGTLLQGVGYRTGLVGKWHVGLRYRRSDGKPAAGWDDADLTQPLFDTPLDHGFDFCRFTSRSHGTSGPSAFAQNKSKRNHPNQSVGPGHIHGRVAIGATGNGKQLVDDGPNAYVLSELGGRHLNDARAFLSEHLDDPQSRDRPFFLYYPSNANHGPYTPDDEIDGIPVRAAATNVAGEAMNTRSDYIYENDVVLGRLMDFLQRTDDPRNPGKKLIHNTIVVFTSDNGAEITAKTATGPFRSHKGSVYEGGHRVPFIVAWPAGDVGDGNPDTPGITNRQPIGLQDMFATFAEIVGAPMPDPRNGAKGGEDSTSVLPAWRGQAIDREAMLINDHNEAKQDKAVLAIRVDDPIVADTRIDGQWKLFFDPQLLRAGRTNPIELYDLSTDPTESHNLISERRHEPLIKALTKLASRHRNLGGHRLANLANDARIRLAFAPSALAAEEDVDAIDLREAVELADSPDLRVDLPGGGLMRISALNGDGTTAKGFSLNRLGLGIRGGRFDQVDASETIIIQSNVDLTIESIAVVAGNGRCGGFYRIGNQAPLAIYCIDADLDSQDQSGVLSDLGVLKSGIPLRLTSRPHYDVEPPGQWRIAAITIRTCR